MPQLLLIGLAADIAGITGVFAFLAHHVVHAIVLAVVSYLLLARFLWANVRQTNR
jgi:hypothetical protein